MAQGDIISATDYNLIQSKVAGVLGKGAGDSGYGMALQSSQVASFSIVEASHINNLYQDIKKCKVHTSGALPTNLAEVIIGDTIEFSNTSTDKGIAQYQGRADEVVADRLTIAAGQASVEAGDSSFTDTNWNATIYHEITVTFGAYNRTNGDGTVTNMTAADHRRHFFNAGGEILFSGVIGTGTGSINNDWRNLLTAVGTVRFNYTETTNGSAGTAIGNNDLTANYQTIFTKSASAYGANDYTIQAKADSDSVIRFRIYFNDDKGPNPNYDEQVTARTTSTVQMNRPSNTNAVNVPAPTFNRVRALS